MINPTESIQSSHEDKPEELKVEDINPRIGPSAGTRSQGPVETGGTIETQTFDEAGRPYRN